MLQQGRGEWLPKALGSGRPGGVTPVGDDPSLWLIECCCLGLIYMRFLSIIRNATSFVSYLPPDYLWQDMQIRGTVHIKHWVSEKGHRPHPPAGPGSHWCCAGLPWAPWGVEPPLPCLATLALPSPPPPSAGVELASGVTKGA